MIIYTSSKNRHTSEGWSWGFAQHAVRQCNGWLMQKPTRPARGYPVECQFSPYNISAMHLPCLDSGLRQNDEKVLP